ncbi:MAG: signal peptidase I [Pseudomonadota bacterium]
MLILFLLFILLNVVILAPAIMIGLSYVFSAAPLSYKKSLVLCLQISVIGIVLQLLTFSITTLLPPLYSILNIVLLIVLLVLIIALIKKKVQTTVPKAILIQIINIVFAVSITLVFKQYVIQAFKIPAESNVPTILIGDHVLVNKYIYKFHQPQKNDWVIFKFPKDEKIDYLKRIVALPGDQVEIKDKILYINNQLVSEPFVINSTASIIDQSKSPRDNFGPVTVPEKSYFVLGDNRDNSFDSRFWGFVKEDKIMGKVEIVYFSYNNQAKSIRYDRVGLKLK